MNLPFSSIIPTRSPSPSNAIPISAIKSTTEFFKTLKKGFKIDCLFSIIFLIIFNFLIYFIGFNVTAILYLITIFALSIAFSIDFKYQLIPDEVDIVIGVC